MLVSCGKVIIVHDTEPIVITPHKSNVNCAIWNHNSTFPYILDFVIASCGNDGLIALSHAQKGNSLLNLDDNTKPLSSIAFTSNSQYLASGGQDPVVRIWDLKKKSVIALLKGHYSQVNSVSFNSTDSLIASASNVGDIILHDITTQMNVGNFTLPSKTPGFRVVRFQGRNTLLSGSNDGSLTAWDVLLKEQVAHFPLQHNSKVTGVSHYQQLICSVGTDQKLNFYSIAEKKCTNSVYCENPLSAVAFAPDGITVAVGTLYGQIHLYDVRNTSKVKQTLKGHDNSSVNFLEYQKIEARNVLKESQVSQKSESSKMSILEEIKKESLQTSTNTDILVQARKSQQPPTDQKTNNTQRSFEQNSIKIEDISRKYDRSFVTEVNPVGFSDEQKKYLKSLFDEQNYQMKHLIQDQIGYMQIGMARQFQMQQNEFTQMIAKYQNSQNLLLQKIEQLEAENHLLKNKTY